MSPNEPKHLEVSEKYPLAQEVARIQELIELKEKSQQVLANRQEELVQEVVLYGLSGQLPKKAEVPIQELSWWQRRQLKEEKIWFLPAPRSPRGLWNMNRTSRAVITSSGRIGDLPGFLPIKLAKIVVVATVTLLLSDIMRQWAFKPLESWNPFDLTRDSGHLMGELVIVMGLFIYLQVVAGGIALAGKGLWELINLVHGKHREIEWLDQAPDAANNRSMDSLKAVREWCRMEEQAQRILIESQGRTEAN